MKMVFYCLLSKAAFHLIFCGCVLLFIITKSLIKPNCIESCGFCLMSISIAEFVIFVNADF